MVLGLFTQAEAQNPYGNPYSSPDWLTRPTFSPWLELYRRGGVPDIPNYYQFVRPRQRMQRYLLERDRQLQRDHIQLRQLEQQQTAIQQTQAQMLAPQRPPGYMSPTGIGASFMTHGGYFGGSHRGYFGAGR
jgi:hypothetical protein